MKIEILFRAPMRRWQAKLADELSARGHRVRCVAQGRETLAVGVAAALALQKRVFGPPSSLFDTVERPFETKGEVVPDLVIALDGVTIDAERSLEPLFDGRRCGDEALLAMLTSGETPIVRVVACRRGESSDLVTAQVAVEDRNTLSRALDQALARIVSLVLQGVGRLERDVVSAPCVAPVPERRPVSPLIHMARGLRQKIAGRLPGARLSPNDWRIAYRRSAGPGAAVDRTWPQQPLTFVRGQADRFYADPMPFEWDNRTYVFFEDFPYATSKGVIGVIEIAADGTAAAPRTVLEQPFHLSYPFVLRHGDEIYMLPEMCAARRLQLFRADPFPDRWVPDRVLLDGLVVADATPVMHEGRWWLFATLADDGGSSWDQLCLFHAPDLLGPWTPHDDNPVLVDAGAARPAGGMWYEKGTLMRVAQDCRDGYGRGLAICRVDRLDTRGYAQSMVARLGPPEGLGADGVHTLNRVGAFEVIDLRYPRH